MSNEAHQLFLKSPFVPLYQRGNYLVYVHKVDFFLPACPESFRWLQEWTTDNGHGQRSRKWMR